MLRRLILEDVINNDKKSQIIHVIPSTAILYQDDTAFDPLFKNCDGVGSCQQYSGINSTHFLSLRRSMISSSFSFRDRMKVLFRQVQSNLVYPPNDITTNGCMLVEAWLAMVGSMFLTRERTVGGNIKLHSPRQNKMDEN